MPHMSVMPSNIRPAPMKAESPAPQGCTAIASTPPGKAMKAAQIPTCRSSEIAFLPMNHRRSEHYHSLQESTRFPSVFLMGMLKAACTG